MHGPLHCSIVGTCLSLPELRRLARKLGAFGDERLLADYEIHGRFVGKLDDRNAVSIAIQKLLDAKFEGALRKAAQLQGDGERRTYWTRSVDAGLAPAAYWALMSLADLSQELERFLFGEIHMMSHLCGASHRGEARAVANLVREKADVARRLSQKLAQRTDELQTERKTVQMLRTRLREAEDAALRVPGLLHRIADLESGREQRNAQALVEQLTAENRRLAARAGFLELQREHLKARLRERLDRDELHDRDDAAGTPHPPEAEGDGSSSGCELAGRCLLYVGGLPRSVGRIRDYMREEQCTFLHHDGGLEQSLGELDRLVERADIVVFPVTNVSHQAVVQVKALCEKRCIPFCPLRSPSLQAVTSAIGRLPHRSGAGA